MRQKCVITDANILINFIKIGREDILRQLRIYAFYLPEEVYEEITYPEQRLILDQALKEGRLRKTAITDRDELRSYAQYRRQMGDGEAACLAIALGRQWIMACDERKKKLTGAAIGCGEQGLVAAVWVWVALIADDVVQAWAVGVAGNVVVFAAVPLI